MLAVRERQSIIRALTQEYDVFAPVTNRSHGFAAPAPAFRRDGPLVALRGDSLARRFHGWRGKSGQRYVCSVFAAAQAACGFGGAVVLAVRADADGRRHILCALDTGPVAETGDDAWFLAHWTRLGASEWHVHLLASEASQRLRMLEDLDVGADCRTSLG